MKLATVRIQNYKGLKDVVVPLSQFGCLIGENNSGKSSVLQAILLLLPSTSKKPPESEFYDKTQPIRIELRIDQITESDLTRIANDQHRASFAPDVVDGTVTFVRLVEPGGSSKPQLLVKRLGPSNLRWTDASLDPVMKGHSGAELRDLVIAEIPELEPLITAKPSMTAIRAARDGLVAGLPGDQKTYRDEPLGTGLDAGIKNFLPEPIYIAAVKDVADEVKTTDSATFGKLLSLLLEEVQDQFDDVEKQFRAIQKQLSRVVGEDGVVVDERIVEVRAVEEMLNKYVQQSFPDVGLTISVPVPKMKTILSSAEISADDGYNGSILSKGDGLKRAVAFAILRAYTSLRASGIANGDISSHYWLLFEEPELYLYPRAQKQLFSALEIFARDHPVMVTTHSPIFFDAGATQSFVKFRKVRPNSTQPPQTQVHPIMINDVPTKTAFQMICHENNSIGFFAKKVVLVEGDSDVVLFQHIAKLLDVGWDSVEKNIAFVRTNGKGNIANYRLFFGKFDIPVHVICDLDALVGGFAQLGAGVDASAARDKLLQMADALIAEEPASEISEGDAKKLISSGEARALWRTAKEAGVLIDGSDESVKRLIEASEAFFALERKGDRVATLRVSTDQLQIQKQLTIDLLRGDRTHVLSLGAVEEYYASSSKSRDKVQQAMDYSEACTSIETFRSGLGDRATDVEAELRTIMAAIFEEQKVLGIDFEPAIGVGEA